MKSIFKRSAIGLVVLGLSGSTFAYHQGNANQGGMWMPQVNGAFIGVEGLYLRPQNGDLDFVTVVPLLTASPFFTKAISTNYQWDWRVYAGIKFTDNDDVTLSWLHFDQNYHGSVFNRNILQDFTPRWGLFTSSYNGGVAGNVNFKLDEAYGVWGHTVHFNNPWSLRWAAGVEYARLHSDMSVAATFLPPVDDGVLATEAKSSFTGWGPRLELDVNYGLPCNFGWFLRTNAVLLSTARTVEMEDASIIPGIDIVHLRWELTKRNVIIPKFGMKVGVSYDYFWGQSGAEGACGTTLTAEMGWQADIYIHAIERPTDGFFAFLQGTPNTKVSNFSDQGLFLGLKVSTDWI